MKGSEKDKENMFKFLVLEALWLLLLFAAGSKPTFRLNVWRGVAIGFGDMYGNQNKGSEEYRRETTYPEFKG